MVFLLQTLFASFDSFLGSFVLGPAVGSGRRRVGLAAAFGLCDAFATVATTLVFPSGLFGSDAAVWVRGAALLYALAFGICLYVRFRRNGLASPLVWTVPLAMSADNWLESAAGSGTAVITVALCSTGLSLLGFWFAERTRVFLSRPSEAGATPTVLSQSS